MIETNTTLEPTTLDLVNRLIASEVSKAKLEMEVQQLQNESSQSHAELYEAFAKAQGEFGVPKKTAKGHFNNMYAPLSEILVAARPALSKYGICFSQSEKVIYHGQAMYVSVVTTLAHSSGQVIHRESLPLAYNAQNAQNAGSILTYLKRYHAKTVLGIEADEEDDASIAQGQIQPHYQNNNYQQRGYNSDGSRQSKGYKTFQGEKPKQYSSGTDGAQSKEKEKANLAKQGAKPAPETNQMNVVNGNQIDKEKDVSLSNDEIARVKATIQRGLDRAKQFGATEDQIQNWESSQDYETVLRELSDFVLSQSKK